MAKVANICFVTTFQLEKNCEFDGEITFISMQTHRD